jgi:hypothetical protein
VYLSYQLVESVTFAQVMSETFHLATDIKAKKKQLIHMVGDQRQGYDHFLDNEEPDLLPFTFYQRWASKLFLKVRKSQVSKLLGSYPLS